MEGSTLTESSVVQAQGRSLMLVFVVGRTTILEASSNFYCTGAVKMEPEHYVYYNLLLAHPVHIRLLGPI